ncbi:MAG TPA: NUDIX domain-containing protein [Actinocrinis sp.]|nr:NUDIX domain-containing protein [Actinocrinis sp.]
MLTAADLDQIAKLVGQGTFEGYPAPQDRLYLDTPGLVTDGPALIVPDGPWQVADHPNRRGVDPDLVDPQVPSEEHPRIAAELSQRWLDDGFTLDQYGRPVHPDWRQLLADPRIGMPTGTGFFYRYGPNATVDPVVYRRRGTEPLELLLIKRRRGGKWALPGGFADRVDHSAEDTARREAGEETGLTKIGGQAETIVYHRSTGQLVTLNAWMENTVVLIHGDQEYLADTEPVAGDDAVDVAWRTRAGMAELDMFDVHIRHIDKALQLIAQ